VCHEAGILFLPFLLAAETETARQLPPSKPKMPEPVLAESITDLDGSESGELEIDVVSGTSGASWTGEVEAEWRALSRLGIALMVDRGGRGTFREGSTRVGGGLALFLFHDVPHDAHLSLEAIGRAGDEDEHALDAEEAQRAGAMLVRGGIRTGPLTLRGALGAESSFERKNAIGPVASSALLFSTTHWCFAGFEALTRGPSSWITIAPNLSFDLARVVPVRLAIAIPYRPAADRDEPRLAVILRSIVELD
jgi:hypothetical protein